MRVFAYRATAAGIARRQQERGQPIAAIEAVRVERAPAALPVADNVVAFRTPKDEFRRIIGLVARMHGSSYRHVMSKTRFRPHPMARQACICAISQAYPNKTLPELGRIFGRDHTTVLWALRQRGQT